MVKSSAPIAQFRPVAPPLEPMLAKLAADIPAGAFLYEPKWDGFRAIVFRSGPQLYIQSRDLRPLDRYFPDLHDALLRRLPPRCVVDGEIVIATGRGLDFDALQMRLHPAESRVRKLAADTPASFVAFDLLAIGGRDLRGRPFSERRARLERALAKAAPPLHLTPMTRDRQVARDWLDRFEGAGLDGVIAKPDNGPYEPGKRVMFKISPACLPEREARAMFGSMDAPRIFLLSPAFCGGRRAKILLRDGSDVPIAVRLQSGVLTIGEAFAFLSGLYFRGKLTYARRFGRAPDGGVATLVITPSRGLMPADTVVDAALLREFAAADVSEDNAGYRVPLDRDAAALAARIGARTPVILLGSIATGKYVDLLAPVFGDRLRYPPAFIGRGDMSRGGLLLRHAAAGQELDYEPLQQGVRPRGPRPPKLDPKGRVREAHASQEKTPA